MIIHVKVIINHRNNSHDLIPFRVFKVTVITAEKRHVPTEIITINGDKLQYLLIILDTYIVTLVKDIMEKLKESNQEMKYLRTQVWR